MEDFDKDYSKQERVRAKLIDLYKDIQKGYDLQSDRTEDVSAYWDIYHNKLTSKQYYSGNSQIFVPIVYNAVEARKTRFSNQIFPMSGRYVDVTTESGDIPWAHMALLEHYVQKSNLRQIIPALMVQGDIEGQYSVYISWRKNKRTVTYRKMAEMPDMTEEPDIESEEIEDSAPEVEIITDSDLLILPANVDSVDEAIEKGGSVTILRRLTKKQIKDYIRDGIFDKTAGNTLHEMFSKGPQQYKDTDKEQLSAAGIKNRGGSSFALVYETWSKVKVGDEWKLCRTYFGSNNLILSCKRNPYWCDKVPLISSPVNKVSGSFKGISPVEACAQMQYLANDAANEAADSAAYALLPIVMTDPEKNPRAGSMVLNLAAIWETSPADTQILSFPQLWKEGFEIVANCKNEIFQTLGVNPAMMPNATGGKKKLNQAEIANEQAVDMLTTSIAVQNIENGILTPLLERFFDYDHQFREDAITVRQFGEMGYRAKMEEVPPIQMDERYHFTWLGVEAARNAQMIQQQISALNVIRGIPPQLYAGHTLDVIPVIEAITLNAFGPRMAPRIFKDLKEQMSIPADMENQMLVDGFDLATSPYDNDPEHLQAHMQALQGGDPHATIRTHIMKHQMQMQAKQAQQMQMQQGQQGMPGGAGPGVAGTPKPGSVPQAPAGPKQMAGAIHQDRMKDASAMPRKM